MKYLWLPAALVALGTSGAALADGSVSSPKLAYEKQCLQCHALDRHTVGPSFQTIQAVYQKTRAPEARMVEVIRQGNDANLGPHWGKARMPNDTARPAVSEREARQLARWILSLPDAR